MKLMIVDDNIKMRQTIKELFTIEFPDKTGYNFLECTSGEEAVECYKKFNPDWVLMDIKLKGMNGIKATDEITKQYPDAKIIIITNHNEENFRIEAQKSGALGFILKENLIDVSKLILSFEP